VPGVVEADVCIVGAGVAGLFAATTLPDGLDVVVLDQGTVGQGSSPYAQGGMAAAVGPEDSPDRHLADTLAAGAGLVDRGACQVMCREAPDRVRDLVELGCEFDRARDGSLHLAREGAQSVPRSVHRADATGAEMVRALRTAAAPRVQRVEGYAFELATVEGRCMGVWALGPDGAFLVRARATLLATGGAGALFASTTNPPASTGAAIALARMAGARLADLEFVQFHPTALAVPESPRPLVTEAIRGAGAHLLDAEGRRFMVDVHPDAELAPRHVVTAAILARGRAFLDARHLGLARLEEEFPTVLASSRERGFDPATDLLPVVPAAHYLIGGVATDLEGRTSLPGLFAAGECAATGVHGANRMAGNSLAEAVVFGRRAALAVAADVRAGAGEGGEARSGTGMPEPDLGVERPADPEEDWEERRQAIVAAVTEGAGPIRAPGPSLAALARLDRLDPGPPGDDRNDLEARIMAVAGRLLVRAALARAESRGTHARSDHPDPDPILDGVHLAW
jgi:L-aspartate oxidase